MKPLQHITSFFGLLRSADYAKGIRFGIAAIVPLLVTGYFDALALGIPMAVGVLLTSPSDVPGSFHRRIIGVSLSILTAVLAAILAGYAAKTAYLFVPVLAVLMFSFSMISVYGFRASLIAFSGLFSVVLSLANVSSESSVLERALLIGCGGIWYLGLTAFMHWLMRRKETDTLLAEAFELTADYLETRNKLFSGDVEKQEEHQKELFELQTNLNEKHETIRELLISRRRNYGKSGVVRKKLLIFMELLDILELGMANPVNPEKMRELFSGREERLEPVKQWNRSMAVQLRRIAQRWRKERKYIPDKKLLEHKEKVWADFRELETSAEMPRDRSLLLVFRNLLVFKEKQFQKLLAIERLLRDWEGGIDRGVKRKDAERFLTTQDYDIKTLQDNLDFNSPIFRHSLRLTITLVAGFFLGKIFDFQNSYWILLTTLVIMRPGYALTRDRFKQRLYGTLLGGAVAVSIVFLVQNRMVYGILAVVCLVLAFAMIQKNYKTAAAFITLNVVFVYSLLRPDVLEVIQFRVLDTIVGALLAFLANKLLWPTWEETGIKKFISESVQANLNYLGEIEKLYRKKGEVPTSYRLARKKAFLAIGDFNAAFQRMAQEPKSGAQELAQVFKLASVNQEFLSSAASLGTFIYSQHTTAASEHFSGYIKSIKNNLEAALGLLENENLTSEEQEDRIKEAEAYFNEAYNELVEKRQLELQQGQEQISERLRLKLQEAQIIHDQLKWLLELSGNLKGLLKSSERLAA
ncbi:MAG: FUSC family membrane protein [Salinimicrobium sp.]